ncbi:conserved hypothetical protein [Culex quinquefasciatus]|uniref:Uncharacterized protein n=1 Tax=Culex quinquefasciatus TaxID=7176 RepID=B0X5E6_CULQU|nr:conserved hypothetical protein [Culex quinquefasciatus]|eukprot:XP_001864868.1 conserved hypothetical protein [Culex quinquefasciatus]
MLNYDFDIQHMPTSDFNCADMLSNRKRDDLVSIIADTIDKVLVSFAALQKATATNAILQAVVKYIRDEWPSSAGSVTNPEVFPYLHQRESLSLVDGCVMFPNQFRHQILRQFHRGHPGSALQRLRAVSSTDSTTKMSNSLSDATLAPLIFFHGFGLADPVAAPVPAIRNSWTTTLKNPTIRSNPVHPKQSSRMVLPPATAALPAEPVSGGRGHPICVIWILRASPSASCIRRLTLASGTIRFSTISSGGIAGWIALVDEPPSKVPKWERARDSDARLLALFAGATSPGAC